MTGAYQRCNGSLTNPSSDIYKSLYYNKFDNNYYHNYAKPNLTTGELSSNINTYLNEKYKYDYFPIGNSIDDTLSLSYVMFWSSGIGREHDGKVKRIQRIDVLNGNIILTATYDSDSNKEGRVGGQCIIFALDIPSANYNNFFNDKKIIFYGHGSSNQYITTNSPSDDNLKLNRINRNKINK